MKAELSEFLSINSIKGFLDRDEGECLYQLALDAASIGPCLEIGSYCGKSTVYIGSACRVSENTLFAVDHHRGSEEHQIGEQYHDSELYDDSSQMMDSFPAFRRTLRIAGLEEAVVPIVAKSALVARHWQIPLGLVFIDGGHSHEMALEDCLNWSRFVCPGGFLAVHDIFERPTDGGQGPYFALQAVLRGGQFKLLPQVNSLGILQRCEG